MNNFNFIVEIKSSEKEELKKRMLRLQESAIEGNELEEIERLSLDSDPHYLGLLMFVLCGDKALDMGWDENRHFIDGMDVENDVTTLYVRENWPDEEFWQKIINETDLKDLTIREFVNKEDFPTTWEFEEDFEICVIKAAKM